MEHIGNYNYQKLNYERYQQNLNQIVHNEALQSLGLTKTVLGATTYGYPLDCLIIGHGDKELFLVGGTHGSEVIGLDFILNFLQSLPGIKEFNPNDFKLVIIPLQNPEGFDISSNTYNSLLDESFESKSYEYYLRYRTDSIIIYAIKEINSFMESLGEIEEYITPNYFLKRLIQFTRENQSWKKLSDSRAIPKIELFNSLLNQLDIPKNFQDLRIKMLGICKRVTQSLEMTNLNDMFLYIFIREIEKSFSNEKIWTEITNQNQQKLYQQMFEKETFEGLQNKELVTDVAKMYEENRHPKGSQVGYDSTGLGINLNANQPYNPGLFIMQMGVESYGKFVKNNIRNYTKGPLGVPTLDPNNFEYAKENQVLASLIKKSVSEGKYIATFLYHGTGGQIFYKPFQMMVNEENYEYFTDYNELLASIYSDRTGYELLKSCKYTGYGDHLRSQYPGVLLIELSKMGGNPIGPYGDKNNIYNTINDNTEALREVFKYFKENKKVKQKKSSN